MSETGAEAPGNGDQAALPQVQINGLYVKDLSFENPNAPQSLSGGSGAPPQIELSVDVQARQRTEQQFEVELHVNASATRNEQTAFVVELQYGGLFTLRNVDPAALRAVCLIECPRLLFPYAARVLSDAVRDGGFAPLQLQPIDFAALFRQRNPEEFERAMNAVGRGAV